ncbi:pyrroloquinoline quinone biosynthesis peptide chaperone PqqD [Pseudonocardia adelaidensis]|uniref:Pyrroloquinoline quinone biosynthesis peptide chaperone PqqD n=1 Tax=Pseudonocardia adelaidensis TaxID=648754 RepID=A0ABP9NHM2_9PSEU
MLARGVRLSFDAARNRQVLLSPETASVLNATGAAILDLCDGERTVDEILSELRQRYHQVPEDEVRRFLGRLLARRCLVVRSG